MILETVALSVITLLLFLLMLTQKPGHRKLLLGGLTAIAAIASLVVFVMMQRAAGRPAEGRELIQLYIPCAVYLIFALISGFTASASRKKLKADKAAKLAAKAEKARAAGAKKAEKAEPKKEEP